MARQKKHRKNPLLYHQPKPSQQQVHIAPPLRADYIVQPSPFLRLSQELRDLIYEQVLISSPDLIIKSFNLANHTIQQHPLSQTSRQLRFEFLPLFTHSAGNNASTIHIHIRDLATSGLDATLKRLALNPHHPLPNFCLHFHLTNNLHLTGRKNIHRLILTGGLYSQTPRGHLSKENIDLISHSKIITFSWNVLDFNLVSAANALNTWFTELVNSGKLPHGSVERRRGEKLWEAFEIAGKETEVWRGALNEEVEEMVEGLLREVEPMLWVRWWLWRRVTRSKVMAGLVGLISVVVALVAGWGLRG